MSLSQAPRNPIKNRLLAALPTEEYERLLPKLETVSLNFKQVLYDINEPIQYILACECYGIVKAEFERKLCGNSAS